MSNFLSIQKAFFCENCKDCGARPVIEQVKGGFIVRCPNDSRHYKTSPGLINDSLKEWNLKNRVHTPIVKMPAQKAS